MVMKEGGSIVGMAQVLVRKFPLGVTLAWIPGGPLGRPADWGPSLRESIESMSRSRLGLYCRIFSLAARSHEDMTQLAALGWQRPNTLINSGMSLAYPCAEVESERIGLASAKWRYNFRRAERSSHVTGVWVSPSADEILAAYASMQLLKGLKEQVARPVLNSMLETFQDRFLLVRCIDDQGRLLAFRGALLMGERGWEVYAAATPEGRKTYASYAVFWELMRQCAARGIRWYDMGGADPVGNKGVYDFKKGTGAQEIVYLGEWDWASVPLLRRTANFLIQRRNGNL